MRLLWRRFCLENLPLKEKKEKEQKFYAYGNGVGICRSKFLSMINRVELLNDGDLKP